MAITTCIILRKSWLLEIINTPLPPADWKENKQTTNKQTVLSRVLSAVYQSDADASRRQRSFDLLFFFLSYLKNIFNSALRTFAEDFLFFSSFFFKDEHLLAAACAGGSNNSHCVSAFLSSDDNYAKCELARVRRGNGKFGFSPLRCVLIEYLGKRRGWWWAVPRCPETQFFYIYGSGPRRGKRAFKLCSVKTLSSVSLICRWNDL